MTGHPKVNKGKNVMNTTKRKPKKGKGRIEWNKTWHNRHMNTRTHPFYKKQNKHPINKPSKKKTSKKVTIKRTVFELQSNRIHFSLSVPRRGSRRLVVIRVCVIVFYYFFQRYVSLWVVDRVSTKNSSLVFLFRRGQEYTPGLTVAPTTTRGEAGYVC